jgi:hemerythrin-like metal-binding protein
MSSFQVSPALQTGHRDIDGQVNTLFAVANEVLFSKELEESQELFQRAIRLFVAYLDYHFASEEIAMARSHYLARGIHSDFHNRVLHEATAIEERGRRGGSSLETRHALLYVVEDGLYYHVKEADREFAEFLCETSARKEIARFPGISDLGASGLLRRDLDGPMVKQLVELGHPEISSWTSCKRSSRSAGI